MNFSQEMWGSLVAIFGAVVGVAALAVFFSKNSNTAGVLNSFTGGLAQDLGAAEAPITGASSYSSAGIGNTAYSA